jgi:hypothetical protein
MQVLSEVEGLDQPSWRCYRRLDAPLEGAETPFGRLHAFGTRDPGRLEAPQGAAAVQDTLRDR